MSKLPWIELQLDRAKLPERDLQSATIELAELLKWRCYHTFDSRRSNAGFPDLVCVRDRVLFIEFKSSRGKLSPSQADWGARLLVAKQEWYEWRPEHWYSGEIEAVLRKKAS